ncbi:MAG: hypothetical protein RMK49_21915, partial [Abditibacteriales bacterium]|nr:hypothetical protein [Abditibacteriales bacterium]
DRTARARRRCWKSSHCFGTLPKIDLIVATHADRLIRWLEPHEVVIVDKVEGRVQFQWADAASLNLKEWLKEYTLDQVWLMGVAGGRP